MTDFRALCAELADSLEEWLSSNSIGGISLDDGTDAELIFRARTALAQPEPQGPTDEDLCKTLHQVICDFPPTHPSACDLDAHQYEIALEIRKARAVLQRWGRPAIEPVPTAERLPGPEDCDEEDQCWLWRTDGIEEFWELVVPPNSIHEYNWTSQWKYTHWLPHHALPVPQQETDRG